MLSENTTYHLPLILYGNDEEFLFEKASGLSRKILLESSHAKVKLDSGNHPDLMVMQPEGKSFLYTTEIIQAFREDIAFPPHESKYKVYLLLHAERMLSMHANALLKTLEEKPDYAVILLVTTVLQNIIPTIQSRCHKILIASPLSAPKENVEVKNTAAALLEAKSRKDYTVLLDLLEKVNEDDSEALLHHLYHLVSESKEGITPPEREALLKTLPIAEKAIESHVRVKHILEYILLQ